MALFVSSLSLAQRLGVRSGHSAIATVFCHAQNRHMTSVHSTSSLPLHDVVIVGGGVTGTALLYSLAAFTKLPKIALIERRGDFGMVASAANNNSQTIHCGDIETNYQYAKAKMVKREADMLRNFATKLPASTQEKCIAKYPKMSLGVGAEECEFQENRYKIFKETFHSMQLISKKEIGEIEPCVAKINTHAYRSEDINAVYIPDEFTGVNYYSLSRAFVEESQRVASDRVSTHFHTELIDIQQDDTAHFTISTNKGPMRAKFVVVSACGYSLLIAQRMGYGLKYSCMPVAGSFYFTPEVLNGKVYTVQDPRLPFAAVHGDRDMVAPGKTRFGPTALPLPMLERYNNASIKDFLKVIRPDMSLMRTYFDLFKVTHVRNYVLRNFLFEIPYLNRHLFVKDAKKIIPSMKAEHLTYAKGFGGVRPQLIDKDQRKLILGEGKINPGNGIIFNITPSPGGTTCLGTAEKDMRVICEKLNCEINEELFKKQLLEGQYTINYM